jgi:hypothetical protein
MPLWRIPAMSELVMGRSSSQKLRSVASRAGRELAAPGQCAHDALNRILAQACRRASYF